MKDKDKPAFIDDHQWAQEVADVKPLNQDKPRPRQLEGEKVETFDWPETSATKPEIPVQEIKRVHEQVGARAGTSPVLQVYRNEAECLFGAVVGMDEGQVRKLKKGQIQPTDCLDLHGFLEGDAWLALMDYLHAAADAEHRCVMVVHGKGRGYGANGDMGVIKAQMAQWLAHHPRVLAFHTAIPRDGGAGAVYVYLRRRR